MAYRNIDMNLSDETLAMQKEVRKFAMDVMRPVGIELDKMSDPADASAEGSPLWDAYKGYRALDLHLLSIPEAFGGMAGTLDPMANFLIAEEMGYGDAGLAVSFGASGMPFGFAAMFAPFLPEMKQIVHDYVEDKKGEVIGCWAITEPEHGGDWSLGGEDPKCGPSVTGELKGDEYIVNGEKAAWVSNGTIATHAVLHVGLDPARGMAGTGLAIIPLDLPGISRGKPLDKMGQRSLNQGSIIFQEARIPKQYMVIVPVEDQMVDMGEIILAGANGGMSVTFAGLAKAAYDEAFNYAQQRVQGGVPIFEHKNIKLDLFKMFTRVEAARANSRRMWLYNNAQTAKNEMPSGAHAVAAKCLSTETATYVASKAIQIFGGNGLAKEYPVEKMFRDARAAMIEDGVNETLGLAAAEYL
ncbi:MAG: acyl-CoA/acyl-ACP dehydrogenase [Proteobacteria bacterium]|nr:acyl-CoA/acyl-ACP dehydrogenase [Pseudomonadota bacterium]